MLSAISVESVVESQLPNDFSDVEIIEQMDTTPITPIPSTSSVSDSTPPTVQTKPDYETLFQNYLKTFKDRMTGLNATEKQSEELAKRLEDIYSKIGSNNTTFLKSSQFAKYMRVFTKELLEFKSDNDVVRHHNDLMIELNRFTQKPEKRNVVRVKDRDKKIKALTEAIKKLQKQIFAAENEELDYESMNNNSVFTDLPKLYRKVEEVWAKREELLKRSTSSGRFMFKKYRCDSTTHPEINKCVEKLFTNHLKKIKNKTIRGYVDESFTFIDVRKAILDEIRDKQLLVMNTDIMIQSIYEDLVKEKRRRREKDAEELFETYETLKDLRPESVVDQNDPLLEIQLAKNRKACDDRMNAVFDNYATEDRRKNGENIQLNDGLSEWDSDLVNNNEEFESIDVKDGDLEEDNVEEDSDDEKSDENIDYANAPIPDFHSNELKEEIKPEVIPIINPIVNPILSPSVDPNIPVLNPSLSPVRNPTLNPVLNASLSPILNRSLSPVLNSSLSPVLKRSLSPVLKRSLSPVLNPNLSPVLKSCLSPDLKHETEEKPKERFLEVITINDEDYPSSDDDDIEIIEIDMTSV